MSDTAAGKYLQNNPLVLIIVIVLALIFLTAYYFIRKSIQPSEYFDQSSLERLTSEDVQENLLCCISFFSDAYESGQLPLITDFMAFRINAAIVFTYYKNSNNVAEIFLKLKKYYFKNKPFPDYTDRYKDRLVEDGREGDIMGAFCLYGCEEFSALLDQEW